jgi:hypothetical protein
VLPEIEDADAEKVTRLARFGGIGTEPAAMQVREALYRPFAARKQVAAYAGLTPSPYASGDRQRDQGISKVGNPFLRKSRTRSGGCAPEDDLRYEVPLRAGRRCVGRAGVGVWPELEGVCCRRQRWVPLP